MGATSPDMGVELSPLPFHPTSGLQALGFTGRGPVWPVMGGSQPQGDPAASPLPAPPADPPKPAPPANPPAPPTDSSDKGFPDNTPVKDMSVDQQAAYYRYQNRQTDNKLAAFKGVTPQDVSTMQQELDSLLAKDMTASEKAIKDAEKAARAAADAEWRPKLQMASLRSIASEVLNGDQLNAWLSAMNPAAFANDQGDIDQEKVMGHLTAAFGVGGQQDQQQTANGRQAPAWGQTSGGAGAPPARPGEAGKAAAAKRFGTST